MADHPVSQRLGMFDLVRLSTVGLISRKVRAVLSSLGIAIGVAAIVAVPGMSQSSSAALREEIATLGTNLLVVTNGESVTGAATELPASAPGMISRIGPVTSVQDTGAAHGVAVYRSPLVPAIETNGLSVHAASLGLLKTVGTSVAQGAYLNAATATEPVAVLGAAAAKRLGIDHIFVGERIWIGDRWFSLAATLNPAALAPELDSSVLVGFPAAQAYLGFDGHPSTIYVRTKADQVAAVDSVLGATANPENPSEADVSRPSTALVAQADAEDTLNALFLGLGAVVLLVGGIGVANIMIISALERRTEIGLRRALGANKRQILIQFLGEAILLSFIGGAGGVVFGFVATGLYATTHGWAVVIPAVAYAAGLGAALLVGVVAGILPAWRAARLPPTEALWAI